MNLDQSGSKFDAVSFLMAYEGGEIENEDEMLEGFQHLLDSGLAWQLQGSYGRATAAMLEAGMLRDPRELRSSLVMYAPEVCPIPPDGEEITRLAQALSKLPKTLTKPGEYAVPREATRNGTDGRVYGGDGELIHIKDGTRADMGAAMATALESMMRSEAIANGLRDPQEAMDQPLCPGCYMVALYDAAVTLAQRNGQPLLELSRSMAQAFSLLASRLDTPFTEEIEVLLDSEPASQPTVDEWEQHWETRSFTLPSMGSL